MRMFLGQARPSEHIAPKRKLLLNTAIVFHVVVFDPKWKMRKNFLNKCRNERERNELANQLRMGTFEQFASYLNLTTKQNKQCTITETTKNKFNIMIQHEPNYEKLRFCRLEV